MENTKTKKFRFLLRCANKYLTSITVSIVQKPTLIGYKNWKHKNKNEKKRQQKKSR